MAESRNRDLHAAARILSARMTPWKAEVAERLRKCDVYGKLALIEYLAEWPKGSKVARLPVPCPNVVLPVVACVVRCSLAVFSPFLVPAIVFLVGSRLLTSLENHKSLLHVTLVPSDVTNGGGCCNLLFFATS